MHIVYLIEFDIDTLPNRYIGSKSNARVQDDKIIGQRGIYTGSSKDSTYKKLIKEGTSYKVTVLGEFEIYEEALAYERKCHIEYDVVASTEYFNKAIAGQSTYSNPAYATYKHTKIDKIARLPRDHPLVLDGTWVGVSKGVVLTEDERKRRGRAGDKNGFFGRTHTEEVKKRLAKSASITHKDKPKTQEQRNKMSESARRRWNAYHECEESRQKESI